ncbi:MAG TPA: NAD(P)H-binding protein [Nitrolancea sp.]|nr:NAD(P)H-binding protein [Nitrolancea sp.]
MSLQPADKPMRLALIGATGYVGTPVLQEAIGRGHKVTAIVRQVDRVPSHANVTPQAADVQDSAQVSAAVSGHDVVISCFNPGGHDIRTNPNFYRDIVEGTRSIIDGVKRSGVGRVVYVGGAGSLYTRPGMMLVDDTEFLAEQFKKRPAGMLMGEGPPSLDIPRGARMAYYLFEREQEIDWTFVSPSLFLGNYGGRTGRLRYGNHELLMDDGTPAKVDVEDLAVAVVDAAEQPRGARDHLTVATSS